MSNNMNSKEENSNFLKSLVEETYSTSVESINMAFALAAALAWTEAIKVIIQRYVKSSNAAKYHIIYASIVTFISALVFMLTKRFMSPSLKRQKVQPVIGMR